MNNKNTKRTSIVMTLCLILVAALTLSMANLMLGMASVIIPTKNKDEIPVGEFGGVEIRKSTFDTSIADVSATHIGATVTHSTNYGGCMSVYNDATESEYHANLLGFSSGLTCSDFSFVMVDCDLTITELSDVLSVGSTHRNSSGGLVGSFSGYSQYLYITPNGDTFDFSVVNDGVTSKVASTSEESFHITIIYRYNHEDFTESDAYVYLDGEFIGSFDGFLSAAPEKLSTFRFHQTTTSNVDSPDQFYVDNYSLYGFEVGYTGAISYLFEDTEYTLFECSDSVLFKG